MAATIPQICDPAQYPLGDAVEIARDLAAKRPAVELHLVQFLQAQCFSSHVSLPTVFRGLEILGALLSGNADENRLITLLRPFLRSSDPQIASKCVLVLGRQSRSMVWLRGVMNETDERIRANLIESLWRRKEPEVEAVLQSALRDPHARVAANAAYGLYLIGSDLWPDALQNLVGSQNAAFRRSGVWVLKCVGTPDAPARLQPLIRDTNADVRKAAFAALKHLRERGERSAMSAAPAA
jgi:hypothetical protein